MSIVSVRRIAQIFFVVLFLWFCVVSTVGEQWWQLRGWPVNWLLQLDPLVALGTLLTTKTLYRGLVWALVSLALTLVVGRFFCGWVCPFGAMHQFIGWLGRRGRKHAARVAANQYRPAQTVKYYILLVLLSAAVGGRLAEWMRMPYEKPGWVALATMAGMAVLTWLLIRKLTGSIKAAAAWFAALTVVWGGLGFIAKPQVLAAASLQTGLLDPIPLVHRSVNLVLLPAVKGLSTADRSYVAAWSIAVVFFGALLLNLWIPRFYCRFICPLGALFGALVRWTPFRVGKRQSQCSECGLCEAHCEGAAAPYKKIRLSECLLCMNCLKPCRQAHMTYGPQRSMAGEVESPGLTRRGVVGCAIAGVAAAPAARLSGAVGQNWDSSVVRPPGALTEELFLERCIKCGQCMRACPTNVIQPALLEAGLEGMWTPVMNFRIGTSGCQLNCIACGNVCPTAAIRPITLEEKLGRGEFEPVGPIRMGAAFVDRTRCLPWAMETPCIVCQENCPVSPKAIYLSEEFQPIHEGVRTVCSATPTSLVLEGLPWRRGKLATGDYFVRLESPAAEPRRLIAENSAGTVSVAPAAAWAQSPAPGSRAVIEVRLQKPAVDPERCIGCGVCQHECPVSGLRAIRVTAENESRTKRHSLTAKA